MLGITSWFFRLFGAKAGALALQFRRLRRNFREGLEMELVSIQGRLMTFIYLTATDT